MTDSYFVTLNDIAKDIKVGVPVAFSGEAGLEVDNIELYVDGFRIGEAGFGRPSAGKKLWELEYSFKGSGKRSLIMTSKANGEVISNRFHSFNVAAKEEVKPETKPSNDFKINIIDSRIKHKTRGPMELDTLIVHFTASNAKARPYDVIASGNNQSPALTYWLMDYNGDIYATHPLTEWGYHCATSDHRTGLGIECLSPGKLVEYNQKLYYWYDIDRETGKPKGPEYPREKARWFDTQPVQNLNGRKLGPQTGGWYVPYTPEQERALVGLVQYLKTNFKKFSIDRVLGHDEVLSDYRDDPGGALSMSMKDFRAYLKTVII